MAKLENSSSVKKQKAKKRKNPNPEHEDEVANKSVILEQQNEEATNTEENSTEQVITKKSKKRKNKEKGAIKEKRSKNSSMDGDNETEDEEANPDDNDLQEPTLEELRESEKPENNLAIVTGRQKKKEKHLKQLEAQKTQSVEREKQRNEEYLNKWKNNRDEWKFEKLRQISIQQTMFDEDKLSSTVWTIALEYLAGSKGAAKEKVIKMANEVIDEIDKQCEEKETEEDKQQLVASVKYQRARDLLQILDI